MTHVLYKMTNASLKIYKSVLIVQNYFKNRRNRIFGHNHTSEKAAIQFIVSTKAPSPSHVIGFPYPIPCNKNSSVTFR